MDIIIPANTRAVVQLPNAKIDEISERGVPLAIGIGIESPVQIDKDTRMELGLGIYLFEYPILYRN